MKIAFFDSGVGGLSVLLEALETIPEAEFLFYGDTEHVPYGEKTEDEIRGFVDEAAQFLVGQGAEALVLACNTATSVAGEYLRAKIDIPIIGMEPAAKLALDSSSGKRIMVIATPVTVRGNKLQTLIGRYDIHHLVDLHAMPGLVRFAENGCFDREEVLPYIRAELGGYDWEQYDSIVLGCTHFNYFKDLLREVISDSTEILDGNQGTVRQIAHLLQLPLVEKKTIDLAGELRDRVRFYYSGRQVDENEVQTRLRGLFERLMKMQEI